MEVNSDFDKDSGVRFRGRTRNDTELLWKPLVSKPDVKKVKQLTLEDFLIRMLLGENIFVRRRLTLFS